MIYNNEGKKLLHFYIGDVKIIKVYTTDSIGIHLVWGLEDYGKTIDKPENWEPPIDESKEDPQPYTDGPDWPIYNSTLIPEECDHDWEHDKYWMGYFTWYSSVYNYEEDDPDNPAIVPDDNNEIRNYIWVNNTIWNNNNIW